MTHEYSMEWLYHFNCSECKNWWSYPTTEIRTPVMQQNFYCPHCGHKDTAAPKQNQDRASNPHDKTQLHNAT